VAETHTRHGNTIDAVIVAADNVRHHPPERRIAMDAQQVSTDETNWGMFAHLSALIGFIIPFGSIIGPW
jgi:hypothetical protein